METINRRSEAHTHTQSAAYIRSVAPHSASWSRRHHRCKAPLTRRRIERKFSGSPNDGGRLSGAYTTSCTRRAQRQRSPPTTCYTLLALVVYDSIPCRSLDVLSVSFFFPPQRALARREAKETKTGHLVRLFRPYSGSSARHEHQPDSSLKRSSRRAPANTARKRPAPRWESHAGDADGAALTLIATSHYFLHVSTVRTIKRACTHLRDLAVGRETEFDSLVLLSQVNRNINSSIVRLFLRLGQASTL